MFCPNCGTQLPDGSQFCSSCGSRIGAADSQPVQPVPQPQSVPYGQMPYQPNGYTGPIKTDRSLPFYIIMSIITCGIYGYWFVYSIARDMNTMCEGDGENTGGLAAYIVLSIVTCGIYNLWWQYKIGNRLQRNAPRYGLMFQENGTTILMWDIVGILLCCLGPFIAMHIIIKNTNALAMAYNSRCNAL